MTINRAETERVYSPLTKSHLGLRKMFTIYNYISDILIMCSKQNQSATTSWRFDQYLPCHLPKSLIRFWHVLMNNSMTSSRSQASSKSWCGYMAHGHASFRRFNALKLRRRDRRWGPGIGQKCAERLSARLKMEMTHYTVKRIMNFGGHFRTEHSNILKPNLSTKQRHTEIYSNLSLIRYKSIR